MCSGHDPIQGIEPLAVKAVVPRPRRLLRYIAMVLGVLCLLPIALATLFPNANPRVLGQVVGSGVILVSIVIWLAWHRPWLLVFGCLTFVVLAVAAYLGAVAKSTANFRMATAMPFVQEVADGKSVFIHKALGITVEAPGTKYTKSPVTTQAGLAAWSFVDQSTGRYLGVVAMHQKVDAPAKLQDCLHDFLRGFEKQIGNKFGMKLVGQETVSWDFDHRYAEVEGTIKNSSFCVHMLPVDSGRAGYCAVFAVVAIARDQASACDMARSLCVTNFAWAGESENDPKRAQKAALVKR